MIIVYFIQGFKSKLKTQQLFQVFSLAQEGNQHIFTFIRWIPTLNQMKLEMQHMI